MSTHIVTSFAVAAAVLAVAGWSAVGQEAPPSPPAPGGETAAIYTCPHHPQIQWPRADRCPLCEMKLVLKQEAGPSAHHGDHESMSMDEHSHGAPHAHGDHHPQGASHGHGAMGGMMGAGCMHCMKMMGMGMNGKEMPAMHRANPTARPASAKINRQRPGTAWPRRGGCGR